MSDPAIKLFGKTIQLPHPHKQQQQQQQQCCDKEFKGTLEKERAPTQIEDTCSHPSIDESINQPTSLVIGINDDDPKTPTTEKETSSKSTTKKDNPIENANSEERAPKPDKIIPCPRCNSMDTKFCYYNNYNVNQPRHFCKNCQRYWTAGGTMRNTPVGSGRRKNKSSPSASSYYRHLIVSEALHPALKSSGSVLNFGSHVPLCESMNSALNFSDKSQKAEDDRSSSVSNSVEKRETNGLDHFQGYPIQIPCFPHPAPPWPYRGPPGIPVNFYPAPQYHWGCTVQVPPSPWSMQYIAPTSPLGKHSRDGNLLSPSSSSRNEVSSKDKNSESSILVPKTLRINEPNEAAKNSLWSTLGISKEGLGYNTSSVNGGNLCKAFQPKSDEKNEVDVTSLVNLQANPAALSRSHNFRETS